MGELLFELYDTRSLTVAQLFDFKTWAEAAPHGFEGMEAAFRWWWTATIAGTQDAPADPLWLAQLGRADIKLKTVSWVTHSNKVKAGILVHRGPPKSRKKKASKGKELPPATSSPEAGGPDVAPPPYKRSRTSTPNAQGVQDGDCDDLLLPIPPLDTPYDAWLESLGLFEQ